MQNPNKTIGPQGTQRTSKDDHKRSQVTSKEPAIATDKRVIQKVELEGMGIMVVTMNF